VPGLRQQRWLEGQRTVLIYGGSLLSEPDSEQYAALRKLRRGRPLDGIVRVMPSSLTLTPQISESDLRAGKNQRTAALCRPGLAVETVRQ
jgi:type VI secretion system protein ImpL